MSTKGESRLRSIVAGIDGVFDVDPLGSADDACRCRSEFDGDTLILRASNCDGKGTIAEPVRADGQSYIDSPNATPSESASDRTGSSAATMATGDAPLGCWPIPRTPRRP